MLPNLFTRFLISGKKNHLSISQNLKNRSVDLNFVEQVIIGDEI